MRKASVLCVLALGLSAAIVGPIGAHAATSPCKRYQERSGCSLLSGTSFLYTASTAPSRLRPALIGVTASGPRSGAKATSASLGENNAVPCSYLGVFNGHFVLKGKLAFGSTLTVNSTFRLRHSDGIMRVSGTAKVSAKSAALKLRQKFVDNTGKVTCDQQVNVTAKRAKQT